MDIITLKNGKSEIMYDFRDFLESVEKFMGWDARHYLEEYAEELQEAANYTEARINSDLDSYESDLESNTCAFNDIEDICRTMISDFNQETGRNKLAALRPWRNHIEQILRIVHNQI